MREIHHGRKGRCKKEIRGGESKTRQYSDIGIQETSGGSGDPFAEEKGQGGLWEAERAELGSDDDLEQKKEKKKWGFIILKEESGGKRKPGIWEGAFRGGGYGKENKSTSSERKKII